MGNNEGKNLNEIRKKKEEFVEACRDVEENMMQMGNSIERVLNVLSDIKNLVRES